MAKTTNKNKTVAKKAAPKKATAKKTTVKKATTAAKPKRSTAKKTIAKKKTTTTKKAVTKKPVKTSSKTTTTRAKKTTTKSTSTTKTGRKVEVVSPVTKKAKKIKGYSKKLLDEFKKVINEKRDEIIEQLQNLKDQMMDSTTGQYVNENSPYSLHMAEQGTDAQEREKLYLWAQRETKFLSYLEDALQRIENKTYGVCIECIDEPKNLCPTCPLIPKDRMMAVPHTQHCVQVKVKMRKR